MSLIDGGYEHVIDKILLPSFGAGRECTLFENVSQGLPFSENRLVTGMHYPYAARWGKEARM